MVHLRIIVPSYQAEHELDLLDGTASVCNLVYLERAARRPEGDVILCDVTCEDASVIVADLRELDIDVQGSISIEAIDSQVSTAAAAADASARRRHTDPVVWEEVAARTSDNVELTNTFLLYMVLAMLIAAVGIYFDEPTLIVGAMVVGPEFGPIVGGRRALVGMLSLTSAKSSALVGALISVATIPAASNMGVAGAYGDCQVFGEATARARLGDGARVRAGLPIGRSRRTGAQRESEPDAF